MKDNPYNHMPPDRFWRTGARIDETSGLVRDIYRKRFDITPQTRIITAGSCFAQHIGRELKTRGFAYLDYEPAPALLPPELAARFGYGLYSARYGNIYTVAQLRQTLERAFGLTRATPSPAPRRWWRKPPPPPVQDDVWPLGERFADPYRPSIEEGGFASPDEVRAARETHLHAVRRLFQDGELFTFTLGLTEAWVSALDGTVYQVCPGTSAGTFDPERHRFRNYTFQEILDDLLFCMDFLRSVNAGMRFLFTVSPVPLTATASGHHVIPATTYSKSVLRAVVGEVYNRFDYVDYFPSYELVTSHVFAGTAFEPNNRSVKKDGVAFVMRHFFAEHGAGSQPLPQAPSQVAAPAAAQRRKTRRRDADDVLCDEEILEFFNHDK